jgi:hypothetical protein
MRKTHITLRQGATIVERGNELPFFKLFSANQFGNRKGMVDDFFPGYQYAERPVSNQSQTLKNSPFGASGVDLWKCETNFCTRITDSGPDIPARKQKLIRLSWGIFQHSPTTEAHSDLRMASSAVSGPSPCVRCVP